MVLLFCYSVTDICLFVFAADLKYEVEVFADE